jgi:hypothetical protein
MKRVIKLNVAEDGMRIELRADIFTSGLTTDEMDKVKSRLSSEFMQALTKTPYADIGVDKVRVAR